MVDIGGCSLSEETLADIYCVAWPEYGVFMDARARAAAAEVLRVATPADSTAARRVSTAAARAAATDAALG